MQTESGAEMATAVAAQMGPLLTLGLILVVGACGGWIAQRLRAPVITGNILAGALMGMTLFRHVEVAQQLQPLSTFAISLIAVSAGGHFSYRRIHNALNRILAIAVCEVVLGFALVYGVLIALGATWQVALVMGCLAGGTAPATTVALIRENRAKGPFVKTLLAVVSVDSSLCILLFAFVQALLADYFSGEAGRFGLWAGVRHVTILLSGSVAIGVGVGFALNRLNARSGSHAFSLMFVAVLFAAGLSSWLEMSPLLTCLIFGAYLANSTTENERQLTALEPIELLVYTCFFTLAGVTTHLDLLAQGGVLCAAYIVARAVGKGGGAALGAWLTRCSPRIRRNIPLVFVPQAGVALGLIVILQGDPRIPLEFSHFVGTLVLAAVTVNEIVGPFCTRAALIGSKEANLDRARLIEFLQEEFIVTDLKADDKWDALRKLVDFYGRTHRIPAAALEGIYDSVVEREKDFSTAIGRGAAIPHGKVESGPGIEGVLGISAEGIDFDSPDGAPVRLIMLIITPKEHERRHLEILATLTKMVTNDKLRSRLVAAVNANDAWEIIEDEETPTYNYFLEDEPRAAV